MTATESSYNDVWTSNHHIFEDASGYDNGADIDSHNTVSHYNSEKVRRMQSSYTSNRSDNYAWECKLEELNKQRKLELQHYETHCKMLEQKVEFQQREVETAVQELVKKNTFLCEVRRDLYKISKHTIGMGNDIVEQLMDRLDRNMVSLQDRIELEQQWTEIHAEFMNQLKLLYPDFTCMECKIAALLRMKLSSSNISAILFISKRTVEFHRLNIRKKMRLSKDDDIHIALLEIDRVSV